ncbi:DUF7134 domain-containing protein [Amycolatopsis minnesotensis]|uniref:DUF7134 domain-containing protein n=1 Tax=Amycolatopsis minnesotensis TaxID=337894 RepID=A0ABN2RFU0_9PSEU
MIDLLLVVLLGAGSVPSIVASGTSWGVVLAITVALLASLFARRRFPTWAMLFAMAVFVAQGLLPLPYAGRLLAADLVLAVLMYAVVVHDHQRSRWGVLLASSEVLFLLWAFFVLGGANTLVVFVPETAIMVTAVATGQVMGQESRRAATREMGKAVRRAILRDAAGCVPPCRFRHARVPHGPLLAARAHQLREDQRCPTSNTETAVPVGSSCAQRVVERRRNHPITGPA